MFAYNVEILGAVYVFTLPTASPSPGRESMCFGKVRDIVPDGEVGICRIYGGYYP